MASSTTRPMASTSARSVSTLMENPASAITPKAPMSETGMTMTGMSVVRQSRRKPKMTRTTSASAMKTVLRTSSMEARMGSVLSKPMPSSMPGGRSSSISATRRWNSSTMSIELASGSGRRTTPTMATPSRLRTVRWFCAASSTRPTSEKRTSVVPSFLRTRFSNSSGVESRVSGRMVSSTWSPSMRPPGSSTFWVCTARCTSPGVRP